MRHRDGDTQLDDELTAEQTGNGHSNGDPQQFPPPMPPEPTAPAGSNGDGHIGTPPTQDPPPAPSPEHPRRRACVAQAFDETAWSTEAAEQIGPQLGWRAGLSKIGLKLPKSDKEKEYDRDILRIQRKLAYPQNVAVISLKGGVGKSTVTVGLGSTLAAHRHVSDVVAVDTDTDGSLQQRMPKEQNKAVASDVKRFLLSLRERHLTASEMQVQLFSNNIGLQALVAAEDVDDYSLSAEDYADTMATLHRGYMVNLIDTSPDRRTPTFEPVLQSAHAIVLVTVPVSDAIRKTARFLQVLENSRYEHLLTRTVLIWNEAAPGDDVIIKVDRTKSQFVRQLSPDNDASTCLVDLPLDTHLAAGGAIDLTLLSKRTRRQFERAAALVMDKLPDRTSSR